MIDAVEPLSLVIWSVFFFAAGMYPLGFMLGSSCNTCCKAKCDLDDYIEFNRCIRFVSTDTSAPPTTYANGEAVSMPLHGYSRAVTSPYQVGAVRVPSKQEVPFSVALVGNDGAGRAASSMSDGETQTATFRLKHLLFDQTEEDAVVWNVTLRGVTLPMEPPPSLSNSTMLRGETLNREYEVGWKTFSENAAASVSVYSCRVVSGSQWLDGSVVTEDSLKALLTVSFRVAGRDRIATASFAASDSIFGYMPASASGVVLSYVIEHSRGATRRYTTWQVTVYGRNPATALPEGGLPPMAPIQQRPFSDTLFTATPPEFAGNTATTKTAVLYSDNGFGGSSNSIPFPTVEFVSQGRVLRATSFWRRHTPEKSEYMTPVFGTVSVLEKSWIMKPADLRIKGFEIWDESPRSQWIYDSSVVESFLAGEITVPYDNGPYGVDPIQTGYATPVSTAFTMQVSEPTPFCEFSVCAREFVWTDRTARTQGYPNTVSRTLTYTPTVKLPLQYSIGDEKGPRAYTNLCHGQDTLEPMSMRQRGCAYYGSRKSCQSLYASHAGNYGAESTISPSASVRHFYCGDLLWVIENGPCRESYEITGPNWWQSGTYEIGGDDDSLWAKSWVCSDANGKQRRTPKFPNGKCPPHEVEVEVKKEMKLGNGYGTYSDAWRFTGTVSAGTYVLLLENESESSGWSNPYGNCNFQWYWLVIDSSSGWVPNTEWPNSSSSFAARARINISRGRETWCSEWSEWEFFPYQGSGFGNQVIYYHLWREKSTGGIENYNPVKGTDFDISSYEEIDPVPITVSPQHPQVPREGGSVTLQRCCPELTETITIPAHTERYEREILIEAPEVYYSPTVIQSVTGATAYVTQAGYDGIECPFDVIWLTGSTGLPAYSIGGDLSGRWFSSERCPIIGQVSHTQQPGCEWSVTATENWIIVGKTEDGLLTISIDDRVPAVYADRLFVTGDLRLCRKSVITITSLGTTKSWVIIQSKP
jgi:hypothetical protein